MDAFIVYFLLLYLLQSSIFCNYFIVLFKICRFSPIFIILHFLFVSLQTNKNKNEGMLSFFFLFPTEQYPIHSIYDKIITLLSFFIPFIYIKKLKEIENE